jgi:hypothetical protein
MSLRLLRHEPERRTFGEVPNDAPTQRTDCQRHCQIGLDVGGYRGRPHADKSMMKQSRYVPSAKITVE